jgi:hypothetical protein
MKGGTVMRRTAWAGLTLLTAPAAFGQAQGMGQWHSEVSTQDGDSIVEPGETATVSLWMDMTPSVGEMLPDGTTVFAFGGGFFDMIAGANADMGIILGWEVNDTLDVGVDGTTDGVSIFDQGIWQPAIPESDDSDPIFLMSFEWRPSDYSLFDASYTPFVSIDVPNKGPGFFLYKVDGPTEVWPTSEHEITIVVVPTPASTGALLIGGLAYRRSRRARA